MFRFLFLLIFPLLHRQMIKEHLRIKSSSREINHVFLSLLEHLYLICIFFDFESYQIIFIYEFRSNYYEPNNIQQKNYF